MIYSVHVETIEVKNRTVECRVRNHTVQVDQPKEFGADDTAPTPPEMLAISLGSCIVSTLQFLALERNIAVRDIRVTVDGDIDFSKAMGISDQERAGFKGLKVGIRFNAPISTAEKDELLKAVFQCGASIDSVQNTTPVTYELVE